MNFSFKFYSEYMFLLILYFFYHEYIFFQFLLMTKKLKIRIKNYIFSMINYRKK
jgi:hypothetical protein